MDKEPGSADVEPVDIHEQGAGSVNVEVIGKCVSLNLSSSVILLVKVNDWEERFVMGVLVEERCDEVVFGEGN